MRWFRTRSRSVSCLALLALTLQLALSFGHLHRKDVLGKAESSAHAAESAVASLPHESGYGTDGSHHDHEDEYCAIYAINGLIGSAQQADPPALLMPQRIGRARHALGHEISLAELHRAPFQARAPPIA